MHWWWRPHVNLKWRCVSTSRHGVTFQKNFHIHLLGNCKFWTLGQPFKFSGHYMYHSSVVTIRTTAQWSLYAPQFSGHYMHHSSVVTICTTVQWSLYVHQFSGHYMYLSSVVTICTTVQWSLYVQQFSGHYMYNSSVDTICTTVQWSLYVPPNSDTIFISFVTFSK